MEEMHDDACSGCGEHDCMCSDGDDYSHDRDPQEDCEECILYGETQCSKHADAAIEAMREEHGLYRTQEALETLVAFSDAGHGEEWDALLRAARAVLAKRGAP